MATPCKPLIWNSLALALAVLSSSAGAAEAPSTTNGVLASIRLQGAARCAVSGCIVNPELHELHKLLWDGDARRRYREIAFEAERIDLISHPEIYDPGIMKKRFGVLMPRGLMSPDPEAVIQRILALSSRLREEEWVRTVASRLAGFWVEPADSAASRELAALKKQLGYEYWAEADWAALGPAAARIVRVPEESSSITAAVALLGPEGGIVRIGPGVYEGSLRLSGYSKLVLWGAGAGATIIRGSLLIEKTKGFVVRDLTVDASPRAGETLGERYAVALDAVDGATLKHLDIAGAEETGLWSIRSSGVLVWDCIFERNHDDVISEGMAVDVQDSVIAQPPPSAP